jgi:hypothetical protein
LRVPSIYIKALGILSHQKGGFALFCMVISIFL